MRGDVLRETGTAGLGLCKIASMQACCGRRGLRTGGLPPACEMGMVYDCEHAGVLKRLKRLGTWGLPPG